MILVLLVTLYTSRVILRILGVEDFGIYNLVSTFVVLLTFLKTALTNATSRYLTYEIGTKNINKLQQVFSMAINTHLCLAGISLIVMEIIGVWFVNHELNIPISRLEAANYVFQFSLLTFCISIIQTPFNSLIIAHERMNFYAFLSILEVLLKLGIVYLLLLSPFDKLISYSLFLLLITILVFLLYIYYSKTRLHHVKYIKFWETKWIKKFLTYSGWSLVVNGADILSLQSINIFFNKFIGITANAALGIASQVNNGINLFLSSFTQAFNPQIIKSYASKDYTYFNKLIFSTSKLSFILFILVAIPITINIDYILKIWLDTYPEHTANYIRAIVIFYLFDSFQTPLVTAVHATGKLKVHQTIIGIIKLATIPSMYLSFKMGGTGVTALIIWSGFNIISALARTIYMHTLIDLDLKLYLKDVISQVVLLLIIVYPLPFLIQRLLGNTFASLLYSTITSTIGICFVGYYITLNKSERNIVNNINFIKKITTFINLKATNNKH